MFKPTLLSSIQKREPQVYSSIIQQLVQRGFAIIEVDDQKRAAALKAGIDEAGTLSGFRFPPINVENITYEEVHRKAFEALFFTAISCLSILTQKDEGNLAQIEKLFSQSDHEPFPFDHNYHPTFFNLFNYNHGALNNHKDRGLVTVIHIDPPERAPEQASSIWIKGLDNQWRSGDRVISEAKGLSGDKSYILMLVGEEGETLFAEQKVGKLYAAEHSVHVHPEGEYIEYSHHQRDPQSRATQNRLSAALILRRN